jgi:hypothetical protein
VLHEELLAARPGGQQGGLPGGLPGGLLGEGAHLALQGVQVVQAVQAEDLEDQVVLAEGLERQEGREGVLSPLVDRGVVVNSWINTGFV